MFAYLDGATFSMMAAAAAGGIAGIAVLFRVYWHRFLGLFSKKHRAKADEAQALLLADSSGHDTDAESDVSANTR